MDQSSSLSWLFVVLGIAASLLVGYRMRGPKQVGDVIVAGVLAIAIGATLSIGASFAHTACIENFRLCTSRGDENLSVWLRSLVATPAYWICLLVFAKRSDP
jgi:hypothetical protein